jgi:hypothetical protein
VCYLDIFIEKLRQLTLLLGGEEDRTAERSRENMKCDSGAVMYNRGSRRDRAIVAVPTA